MSSWTLCYHTLINLLRGSSRPCTSFSHIDALEAQLHAHVCHSGCRASLGMMSTSEPTFSSASAASARSSCILISFSTSSVASLHEVHTPTQGQVLGQGKAHHTGSLSQCQNEFDKFVYSLSGFQLALTVCNAGAAASWSLS